MIGRKRKDDFGYPFDYPYRSKLAFMGSQNRLKIPTNQGLNLCPLPWEQGVVRSNRTFPTMRIMRALEFFKVPIFFLWLPR